MNDSEKTTPPLPEIDDSNREFWNAAKRGEFRLYTCGECGSRYYPAIECTRCSGLRPSMSWEPASGKGKLVSWIVMHKAYHEGFRDMLPYNVALVHLDEGPFFLTNITGVGDDALRYEMPVTVNFQPVTDEITLPRFKPTGSDR
jgi:hypothetical protein